MFWIMLISLYCFEFFSFERSFDRLFIFYLFTAIRAITHRKKCNVTIYTNVLEVKFCPFDVPKLKMSIVFL